MDNADSKKSNYAGMTVNERLFAAGIVDEFDDATRARDRARMITLLAQVDVEDAEWSVDTILADPEKYGF